MDPVTQLSAFEVYTKKQNNVQPLNNYQKSKQSKKSKTIKNDKIEKKKNKIKEPVNLQIQNINLRSSEILKNSALINLKQVSKNFMHSKSKIKSYHAQEQKKTSMVVKNGKVKRESTTNVHISKFDQIYSEVLSNINQDPSMNPVTESEKLFEWLIYPLTKDEFFQKNWEKTPLYIKRNKPKYYKSLLSTPMLDKILRENYILFTKNIDITSFTNNIRETHNPPGRAFPSVVWDYFANGCSVRMLNPQTYVKKLCTLNSTLQEYFNCFVGSNFYLTPPNSQGFAPHYDDIEAFVLQIEGKKRWRLYKPRNDNEYLPRHSSVNFSQKEIGKPILDTVVNAGDLLYFPRGTIHQADTIDSDEHSLHITLSVYQKNSWGDFLEKLVPAALNDAIKSNIHFRKGLPLDYLSYTGSSFSNDKNDKVRQEFLNQTKTLFNTLTKYIDIDKAADEMAKSHIHDYLPPVLDEIENECSILEGGERMIDNAQIVNRVEIEPDTYIRLSRAHCARLVEESDSYRLYYSSENSKEYHEYELQFLEVDFEFVSAIKLLISSFPHYIRVEDLSIKELDKKIQLVRDLWEKAIVISKHPLPTIED